MNRPTHSGPRQQQTPSSAASVAVPALPSLPTRALQTLMLGGTLAVFVALALASATLSGGFSGNDSAMWGALALMSGLALLSNALNGLYRLPVAASGWPQVSRGVLAWLLTGSLLGAISLFPVNPLAALPGTSWVWFVILGFSVMTLVRLGIVRPWLRRTHGQALRGAVVIVGTGAVAQRVAAAIPSGALDPVLVGFADSAPGNAAASGVSELMAPLVGDLDVVRRLAQEGRISQVLVAGDDLSRGRLVELAHEWLAHGVGVTLVSSAFEVMVSRAQGKLMGGLPVVELRPSPQQGLGLALKRALDVTLVVIGGLIILPLLAGIALAIRMDSPGPVLYRQQRVGRRGTPFSLFKFRSMVVNNNDALHRDFVQSMMQGNTDQFGQDGQKIYKMVNDPRITRVGAFVRRFSLDELPQLWNVLLGDMSLVGPRPCLPYEWDLYEGWQRHRLDVLPGITGLWQVTGRSQVTFEEMVLLDLHYIANWSIGLDLVLLTRTIPVVVSGEGGH